MRRLSADQVLGLWERGRDRPPVERALVLLAGPGPDTDPDAPARWSVGRRDAELLALREALFGSHLAGLTTCQRCGEQLELQFEAADVRVAAEPPPDEVLSLELDEYRVEFRLPNSLDLAALQGEADAEAGRGRLLRRCLVSARQAGAERSPDELPAPVLQATVEAMGRADPRAAIELAVACPACHHEWRSPFDIATFLWGEIEGWARRLLREVHTLARAYGWREADILALSPLRRQAYLEMVGA